MHVGITGSPDLDAADLLQRLCGGELPANVAHELSAWSEHGEKFALYVNSSVLETEQDAPAADRFTVKRVGEGIRLIRSPDKLFHDVGPGKMPRLIGWTS